MWLLASSRDFHSPRRGAQSSIRLGLQLEGALGPWAWYQQESGGITDRNDRNEETQTKLVHSLLLSLKEYISPLQLCEVLREYVCTLHTQV